MTGRRSCAPKAARRAAVLSGGVVALLLGGCGNLTSGGYGDLEVLVASDTVSTTESRSAPAAASVAPVFTLSPGYSSGAFVSAVAAPPAVSAEVPPDILGPDRQRSSLSMLLEGTLTLRVQVFALPRADATPIEVTDGVQQVVMPLSGGAPVLLARKSLAEGSYSVIRTVFLHVEALVEGGLVVNGVAIRGPVRVDLGSRLVVDTPVDLTIEEDVPARISVNLHTTRWIRLLNLDRRVNAEDFQAEVRVGRQP